jgi:hypothetical protein
LRILRSPTFWLCAMMAPRASASGAEPNFMA